MRGKRLTERDTAVVVSIYKYRYLTASQIARIHFPSGQTANRRLRSLVDQGHVAYFVVPNIAERIYRLTQAGARLVAGVIGVSENELLWRKGSAAPKDYYFMKHFVAVSDFRIGLHEACNESDVDLLGFIPEFYGKQHASGRVAKYIKDVVFDRADPAKKITHTPDAVFALSKNGSPALFFLELDRGTETISNPERGVFKMIRFYESLAAEGKYRGYAEDFGVETFKNFRLLIVTTSANRIANMKRAVGGADRAQRVHAFFWLTTAEALDEGVFRASWTSLAEADMATYQIAT